MNKNTATATSIAGPKKASVAPGSLAGRRVLITRPSGQQEELCTAVEAAGGEAVSLPLLAIEPVIHSGIGPPLRQDLDRLPAFDTLIFISANAARHGAAAIAEADARLAPSTRIFAVGSATAREASLLLDRPVLSPSAGSGSEALLQMPELADVANRKVAIFRGEGGRELLAEALQHRGAQVTYCEVYRRVRAPDAAAGLQQILAGGPIDSVIITSAEALEHWHALVSGGGAAPGKAQAQAGGSPIAAPFALPLQANECAHHDVTQLLATPVAAPSRRVAELATQSGFSAVVNAGGAEANVMVEALAAHFRQRRT